MFTVLLHLNSTTNQKPMDHCPNIQNEGAREHYEYVVKESVTIFFFQRNQ